MFKFSISASANVANHKSANVDTSMFDTSPALGLKYAQSVLGMKYSAEVSWFQVKTSLLLFCNLTTVVIVKFYNLTIKFNSEIGINIFRIFNRQPGILCTTYIEFIDSTGLNYIMFAHNSVLRNYTHPENNLLLSG